MSGVRTSAVMAIAVIALMLTSVYQLPLQTSQREPPTTASSQSPKGTLLVPDTRSPIKHVIVVIQENHAFDNFFNSFPGVFGVPPGGVLQPTTKGNVTSYSGQYALNWNYGNNQSFSEPAHAQDNIISEQDNDTMDGFYYTNNDTSNGLYPSYIVSNELGLAQEYGVADNYYTGFAGPTLPNRFYYYSITSGPITGDSGPANNTVFIPSLPQELQRYNISWADYAGNYNEFPGAPCIITSIFPTCPSWYFETTLSQLMPLLYLNWIQQEYNSTGTIPQLQYYDQIYTNLTAGTLPAVSWFTSEWTCCTEHPGSFLGVGGNVSEGEQSILQLVHAVEDSKYWNSTAIFLSYDEGGGFFDSSPSPVATPYGSGVRVPLVVISPYSKEGYISHTYLTPASILHFIEWNWNIPSLGALDSEANLPLGFFNFSATPRSSLPGSVYGASNLTSVFPWNYTQPVSSSYKGVYVPQLVEDNDVNWSYQSKGPYTSSPVVSGNQLYTCGMDGYARSFDPTTGAQLWDHYLGSACRSSPTALPEGGVVTTTLLGNISGFYANGSVMWSVRFHAPIYNNLTYIQGTLYGSLQNGTLFALDSSTGAVLWVKHETTAAIYAQPVYDPSTKDLIVSDTTSGVFAVNLSGDPQWTSSKPIWTYAAGTVCGSTYYVTTTTGGLYPVSALTGIVGTAAPLNYSVATPMCLGSDIYVGDNTSFDEFSLPSLSQVFRSYVYGEVSGTPAIQSGNLMILTQGGNLYYYPEGATAPSEVLTTGTSMFSSATATSSMLYFTSEDGNVYALANSGAIAVSVVPQTATVKISSGNPVILSGGKGKVAEVPGIYTLTATAPGYYSSSQNVTVTAGRVSYANFSLSEVPPPSISSFTANPSSFIIGNQTTLDVVAAGGAPPYSYAYGGLPTGCGSLNLSQLNCTPTRTGVFSISVSVTDTLGKSANGSTTIYVNASAVGNPVISSFIASPNPDNVSSPASLVVTASGGATPYSYLYSNLPTGCATANESLLPCIPTSAGNFNVTVSVTDSRGHSASAAVLLVVSAPSGYPVINSFTASPPVISLGSSTILSVSVSGGTSPYSYLYSSLPPGCSSASSATLTCTPTSEGNFTISVTVTDAKDRSVSDFATLSVRPAAVGGPTITGFTATPNPVTLGGSTSIATTVTGGVAPYTYSYSGLPAGCSSSDASSITCTPTQTGNYSVEVTVSDSAGHTTNDSISVKVIASTSTTSTSPQGYASWLDVLIIVLIAAVAVAVLLLIMSKGRKGEGDRAGQSRQPPPPHPTPEQQIWSE